MASLLRINLCSPPPISSLKSRDLVPPKSLSISFDPLKSLPGSSRSICAAVKLSCPFGGREERTNEEISQIFEDWCKEHGKRYTSDEYKLCRFQHFKYNYEYVQQHNHFTEAAHTLCLNRFSDLTADDFVNYRCSEMYHEAQLKYCEQAKWLNELLAEGHEHNKLTVVACMAKWCRPCVLMEKVMYDLAPKMPLVSFVAVDVVVDELKAVAVENWEVQQLPTILFVKNGQVVDKVEGAKRDEFYLKLAMHLGWPWGSVPIAMWNSP